MIQNDYYAIACNDLDYLQMTIDSPFYNNIAAQCQQTAEKLLKSVAEICVTDKNVLNSHHLRRLNEEIKAAGIDLGLCNKDLALLKDYYYDARYPGEDFVNVTKEECAEGVSIMNQIFEAVNRFRAGREMKVTQVAYKEISV